MLKRWLSLARNDPAAVAVRILSGRRGLAWLYEKRNMVTDPSHVNQASLACALGVEQEQISALLIEVAESGLLEHFHSFAKDHAFVDNYWCAMTGAPALYVITRIFRPITVVETGAWWGLSSACLLLGMRKNGIGKLISIDIDERSGGAIPGVLRKDWQLLVGPSSRELLPLLQSLNHIDMFVHDSDHSYENMRSEFRTAWPFLKEAGLLLSDDINLNSAFADFALEVGRQPGIFYERADRSSRRQMGIIRK